MSWFGISKFQRQEQRPTHRGRILKGNCTLDQMHIGQKAKVVRVDGSGQIRHRLIDFGFHSGETIEMIRSAPLRDPLEIALNGGRISIRRSEAVLVTVELIPAYK